MAFAHPIHTSRYLCLNYSADKLSTPKQLTHCYRLTLNLAAFCCACGHFSACTTFADRSRNSRRHFLPVYR
ncbi:MULTISPECIES: hypothetical protein [Xenorhabdus]|uniref:hypothetical protein n=1 Tax=Xenorhabdus TaxID=626 RepID=UPI00128B0C6E|nr:MULTISPECIES: hypothetical protein [Xenorhabdus]